MTYVRNLSWRAKLATENVFDHFQLVMSSPAYEVLGGNHRACRHAQKRSQDPPEAARIIEGTLDLMR